MRPLGLAEQQTVEINRIARREEHHDLLAAVCAQEAQKGSQTPLTGNHHIVLRELLWGINNLILLESHANLFVRFIFIAPVLCIVVILFFLIIVWIAVFSVRIIFFHFSIAAIAITNFILAIVIFTIRIGGLRVLLTALVLCNCAVLFTIIGSHRFIS